MGIDNRKKSIHDKPATSPDEQRSLLESLAMDLAMKQLRDGTASSQIITQLLKSASDREQKQLELDILASQKELMAAKTDSIKQTTKNAVEVEKVMLAFRKYKGYNPDEEEDYDNE